MIWISRFAREKINKLGIPGRARSSARAVRTSGAHVLLAGMRRRPRARLLFGYLPMAGPPVATTLSDPPAAILPPPPTASLIYATSANATSGPRKKWPTNATSPPQHVAEDVTTSIANLPRSSHRDLPPVMPALAPPATPAPTLSMALARSPPATAAIVTPAVGSSGHASA